MGKLIVDGNSVYEIDIDEMMKARQLNRKKSEEKKQMKVDSKSEIKKEKKRT